MNADTHLMETAAFLRSRRERLKPEDVGLNAGQRRRTPGLRREEVAMLAGVSTEWYTRLEQGRQARASRDALIRIGTALKLEPSEQRHLLELSDYGGVVGHDGEAPSQAVSANLQHVLNELEYCPAYVLGRRWDILAWNAAAVVVFGDFAALPTIERNCLHEMFLGDPMSTSLVDWERHAKGLLGGFRAQHARHLDDPWFAELVDELRAGSAEFADWWDDYDVAPWHDGTKELDHPELGRLTFEHTAFDLADARLKDIRLITYVPAEGTDTRSVLRHHLDRSR